MPVSATDSAIWPSGARATLNSILPCSVNLNAFDSRFRKTCSSL